MVHKVSLYIILATTGLVKMAKMSVVLERAKVMRLNKASLYIILATTGPVVKRANTRAGIMMVHKLSLHIMPMAKPAEMTERAKIMTAHKVSLYMLLATTEPMVTPAEMAVVLEQVVAIYNIGDNGAGGERYVKSRIARGCFQGTSPPQ